MWFEVQELTNPTTRVKAESDYYSFFRNGLLIDTEILYLLIVGNYDNEKKTNFLNELKFHKSDNENLTRFLTSLRNITFYITPHVFTKFVHLIWENIKEKEHYYGIMDLFMSNFSYIEEKYISKDEILNMEHFRTKYCDLCNASLILTSEIHHHNSVITSDKNFASICEKRGNMLVVYYPDIRIHISSIPSD